MPMRRAISISLACLVTSACATSEILEESKSNDPVGTPTSIAEESAETPADHPRSPPCAAAEERRFPERRSKRAEQRLASLRCGSIPDPVRTVGRSQFGKAVWYDHVGRPTASGEILDTVTATAAHRTLPLASFAKVTNLDNGRSVVVKINDRGPYARGRILDLSPRAADLLDMKGAGVVAVVVEPLVNELLEQPQYFN